MTTFNSPWKRLSEDPEERKAFDASVDLHQNKALAIAHTLKIYAIAQPGGTFAAQLDIMANEVAALNPEPLLEYIAKLEQSLTSAVEGMGGSYAIWAPQAKEVLAASPLKKSTP